MTYKKYKEIVKKKYINKEDCIKCRCVWHQIKISNLEDWQINKICMLIQDRKKW